MKTCTVCNENKPYSEYYKSSREKDGYGYRCKLCDNAARKKSRNRDKPVSENKTKLGYKRRWLFYKYGLDSGDYENMLVAQNYKCAICGTSNPRGEGVESDKELSFSVDHNHKTKKVRGLLCNLCNRALGFFQDDPSIVQKAAEYLNTHL